MKSDVGSGLKWSARPRVRSLQLFKATHDVKVGEKLLAVEDVLFSFTPTEGALTWPLFVFL